MATINKKLAASLGPPAWASFFTPSQYADFLRLLAADLQARGLTCKEDDGYALLRRGGGQAQRVGLLNIAQMCHMELAPRWPDLIKQFCDNLLKVDHQLEGMVASLADINKVRDRIKLRLQPSAYRHTPGATDLVLKSEADGLVSVLVCDMTSTNISVPQSMVDQWGMSADEVYDLALNNTLAQEKVTYVVMPRLPNGVILEAMESQSNYATSHVLRLEQHLKQVSSMGVIFGVPNRHLVFLHRLQDEKFMLAMGDLWTITEHAYRDGPGSISQDLYWWRPGHAIRRLPVVRRDQRIEIIADPEFHREVMVPLQQGN